MLEIGAAVDSFWPVLVQSGICIIISYKIQSNQVINIAWIFELHKRVAVLSIVVVGVALAAKFDPYFYKKNKTTAK